MCKCVYVYTHIHTHIHIYIYTSSLPMRVRVNSGYKQQGAVYKARDSRPGDPGSPPVFRRLPSGSSHIPPIRAR